jgi:hypothetical protein
MCRTVEATRAAVPTSAQLEPSPNKYAGQGVTVGLFLVELPVRVESLESAQPSVW